MDNITWPENPPQSLQGVEDALVFLRNTLGRITDVFDGHDMGAVIEGAGVHVEAALEILENCLPT